VSYGSSGAPAPPDVPVARARSTAGTRASDGGVRRRGSLGALRRWFSSVGRRESRRERERERERPALAGVGVGECLEVVHEAY
jgi:hypothetical protein